jgi:hypothetical protein
MNTISGKKSHKRRNSSTSIHDQEMEEVSAIEIVESPMEYEEIDLDDFGSENSSHHQERLVSTESSESVGEKPLKSALKSRRAHKAGEKKSKKMEFCRIGLVEIAIARDTSQRSLEGKPSDTVQLSLGHEESSTRRPLLRASKSQTGENAVIIEHPPSSAESYEAHDKEHLASTEPDVPESESEVATAEHEYASIYDITEEGTSAEEITDKRSDVSENTASDYEDADNEVEVQPVSQKYEQEDMLSESEHSYQTVTDESSHVTSLHDSSLTTSAAGERSEEQISMEDETGEMSPLGMRLLQYMYQLKTEGSNNSIKNANQFHSLFVEDVQELAPTRKDILECLHGHEPLLEDDLLKALIELDTILDFTVYLTILEETVVDCEEPTEHGKPGFSPYCGKTIKLMNKMSSRVSHILTTIENDKKYFKESKKSD